MRVEELLPHPDAHSLELLVLSNGVTVVVGRHYEQGQLGVYVPGGHAIPGWLAEESWMVKKGDWLLVEPRVMRGVPSPGIFLGERYRKTPEHPWEPWAMWRPRFAVGDDITGYLGVLNGREARLVVGEPFRRDRT